MDYKVKIPDEIKEYYENEWNTIIRVTYGSNERVRIEVHNYSNDSTFVYYNGEFNKDKFYEWVLYG